MASTLFVWTGALGASKTGWNDNSGTLTNWSVGGQNSTIAPGAPGDVAVFNNGALITVTAGSRVDEIEITDNTFVTFSNGSFASGDLIAGNNAQFPFDLNVDDDSKLTIAGDASMSNDGSTSVIGLGGGATGNGTLEVDPGGSFSTDALIIGDSKDGDGVVTVNGAGGFFVVSGGVGDGAVTIGNVGIGSLSITNTPAVFTQSGTLGATLGAAGTMSLDSSTWGGGDLIIGDAGTGHVTIGAAASVALASVILGSANSGTGDLTVGASSFMADFLTIGADGTGTAAFEVGSTGTFTAVTVGASVDAVATLTMDGSIWNSGSLTIGGAGDGHATASAGDVVTVNNAVLGSDAGVSGDLTIDAAALNGGTLTVGQDGTGDLAIESSSTGSVTLVTVGGNAGSSGTLTIDGSDWGAGTLTVGEAGSGQATVGDGATSTIDNILIGPDGGLAVTQAAGAVGTVIAQQVSLDFGTLDLSAGGAMLIGAAAGAGGAVAIGSTASLTGLGLLKGEVDLSGAGAVTATGPVPGALKIDGAVHGGGALQPLMTLEVNGAIDAGVTISFGVSTAAEVGDLVLDVPTGEQGTIEDFGAGNTIDVQGSLYDSAVFTQGTSGDPGTLVLSGGTFAPLSLAVLGNYASDAFTATPGTADTIVTVVPCFVAGTHVLTAAGEKLVEDLHIGDHVVALDRPRLARSVWCGHRRIDCRRQARPADIWPVRVHAGTFGGGLPVRDLLLSPDHSVFVNGVLVPVHHLINGATIVQEPVDEVTYYHVELASHDVILAEGLPCESYLDTGNRAAFVTNQDSYLAVLPFAVPGLRPAPSRRPPLGFGLISFD